jgi:hypothetical protein
MSLVIKKYVVRRRYMEKLKKMIEDVMVAITFAEAGEFDEANRIAGNEILQDQDEKSADIVSVRR